MADDISDRVVEVAEEAMRAKFHGPWTEHVLVTLAAAMQELNKQGYRLVRDDEATVERMKRAIHVILHSPRQPQPVGALEELMARAALTAAQGGEDQ